MCRPSWSSVADPSQRGLNWIERAPRPPPTAKVINLSNWLLVARTSDWIESGEGGGVVARVHWSGHETNKMDESWSGFKIGRTRSHRQAPYNPFKYLFGLGGVGFGRLGGSNRVGGINKKEKKINLGPPRVAPITVVRPAALLFVLLSRIGVFGL